jgi:plasmid replication initiation protein
MFLDIQYSFSLKYSKLLYELLKDYEGINKITINYDLLLGLLNVKNVDRYSKFSYFNGEILKPSMNEINEKSDILIDFEPIKEKPNDERMQVTKIKFTINKQSTQRLEALGLISQTAENNKHYKKSKSKLDALVKNGYKVVDEEMWIETDIKKNSDRYDSEYRIDTWIKETDAEDKKEIYQLLATTLEGCDDPMVIIDNYKIIGVFSKDAYTRNPQETIEQLNSIIKECNDD